MIRIENLSKYFQSADATMQVLKSVSLHVDDGELVALIGESGAGKSTLLNIIGMLDVYEEGSYFLNDILIKDFTEDEKAAHRNKLIGFIFQRFNLLPFKTALENVTLPLYYQNVEKEERNQRAMAMLTKVGLGNKTHHLPNELSGGQQQRVAIARALVTEPGLILADEPTGALDHQTSQEILALLEDLNREGRTIVMVTHDLNIAARCQRTITIEDGRVV